MTLTDCVILGNSYSKLLRDDGTVITDESFICSNSFGFSLKGKECTKTFFINGLNTFQCQGKESFKFSLEFRIKFVQILHTIIKN